MLRLIKIYHRIKLLVFLKNSLSKELKENETSSVALNKVFYSYLKTALHLYLQMDASIK